MSDNENSINNNHDNDEGVFEISALFTFGSNDNKNTIRVKAKYYSDEEDDDDEVEDNSGNLDEKKAQEEDRKLKPIYDVRNGDNNKHDHSHEHGSNDVNSIIDIIGPNNFFSGNQDNSYTNLINVFFDDFGNIKNLAGNFPGGSSSSQGFLEDDEFFQ